MTLGKRQQCQKSSNFNFPAEFSLMGRANSGNFAGDDFSSRCGKSLEKKNIFVRHFRPFFANSAEAGLTNFFN